MPAGVPDGTRVLRDVAYVSGGHERQKLDLYVPAGTGAPRPLVVWVHGGAFRAGSKDDGGPALALLKRGYAVASLNYRLSQHALFPAQLEDCKAAVRWLRAHATEHGLDPDRIAAWGASAGGHLVAMLGTTGDTTEFDVGPNPGVSSRVQAVVDWFGPTDFRQMNRQGAGVGRMDHDAPDSPESQLVGGPIQANAAKVARANPITYVTAGDPPMLLVHGDRDPLVPYGQSVLLQEALAKAGVESTLHTVKGGGHGQGFGDAERQAVEAFLDRVLRKR